MTTKKFLPMSALAVVMALSASSPAKAADISISRHDYASGSSRYAYAYGYVTALMPGEVVTDVRVYTYNTHAPTGSAEGTYNANTGYWSIDDGAFDLYSYYIVITTNYYGHKLTYSSTTYIWGH